MKKILGLLSLIAIFTVAFTSQATANDSADNPIVYDISYDTPDIVSVDIVSVEGGVGVFNVTDEPVNYTSVEGLSESVNLVNGYLINFETEFNISDKEPTPEPDSISNRNTNYNSVTDTYSDVEKPVGWNTENI